MTATVFTAAPPIGRKPKGRGTFLVRALRTTSTKVGLLLTLLVLGVAFVGPFLSPHSPTEFVGVPFSPAGTGGPFGTDNLGRDVLSRFLNGEQDIGARRTHALFQAGRRQQALDLLTEPLRGNQLP